MRYRLRTLFLVVFIASALLGVAVPFVRWLHSRPGMEVTGYGPSEVDDIKRRLGEQSLQDLRMWHLYSGGWFGFDYVWQAKAPPEVIGCVTATLKLKPVAVDQVPPEFWKMPNDFSETPTWWQPKPIAGAEYYMSPTFVPRDVRNEGIDGVVMYDPVEQRVYVWSQADF